MLTQTHTNLPVWTAPYRQMTVNISCTVLVSAIPAFQAYQYCLRWTSLTHLSFRRLHALPCRLDPPNANDVLYLVAHHTASLRCRCARSRTPAPTTVSLIDPVSVPELITYITTHQLTVDHRSSTNETSFVHDSVINSASLVQSMRADDPTSTLVPTHATPVCVVFVHAVPQCCQRCAMQHCAWRALRPDHGAVGACDTDAPAVVRAHNVLERN